MKNGFIGKASVTIDAPSAKVWDALTNPAIIRHFFFGTGGRSGWKFGNPVTFDEWEGKKYRNQNSVMAREEDRCLSFTYWSSISEIENKPENYVTITYEQSVRNNRTVVTIKQENFSNKKMQEQSQEIWSKTLANLKDVLENQLVASS